MDQGRNTILFALLRSAVCGTKLTESERALYSEELLPELLAMSQKHDIAHLLAVGLKNNDLALTDNVDLKKIILKVLLRYERLNAEYENLCKLLEAAKIPFIPLKGSVLRKHYPEEWMRTSCDIDVLVHREDLKTAVTYLTEKHQYVEDIHSSYDISLNSPKGVRIELHFDLVEEGLSNHAAGRLRTVWEDVSLRENSDYWYEMTDAFFYFYHIAHMAKHFEHGGCGIRPFIDLWILDHMEGVDQTKRNALLKESGLLQFAGFSRQLSRVWLGGEPADKISLTMQEYILSGGTYGSLRSFIAVRQKKRGGKFRYIWSRIFMPYVELKRYYPVLEKHWWLFPFIQIRRWTKLARPETARKAKKEITINRDLKESETDVINALLEDIGLSVAKKPENDM